MGSLANFMTGLSLTLILMVFTSLRRAHIRVEYSVSWLVASTTLLVASRSEWAMRGAAQFLGIADPPMALVLLVGCLFLFTFYRFTVIISKLRDDNVALAQRLAIMEFYVHQLRDGAASGEKG